MKQSAVIGIAVLNAVVASCPGGNKKQGQTGASQVTTILASYTTDEYFLGDIG
jgi:hypothetical protein